ncbi:MAG: NAD-dependent epimerase/dehydratase family protein [Sphingomonadaceae bacterium]|nr:NAD-dependent epimerase/dehydratase family protein [Sphingomonadaceae bacterium]
MAKILMAGGSGLVGKQVSALLAARDVDVHLVSRRASTPLLSAITEHVAPTGDWPAIIDDIKAEIAISCLGTTIRTAGSRDAFRTVDHDLVLTLARASRDAGTRHFISISSVGAVPASGSFYLRTKAETEQGLRQIGFKRLDVMRPSLLTGGQREDHRPGEALGIFLSPIIDMLMIGSMRKYASTPSGKVAKAIVALTNRSEAGVFIHENDSIGALAG